MTLVGVRALNLAPLLLRALVAGAAHLGEHLGPIGEDALQRHRRVLEVLGRARAGLVVLLIDEHGDELIVEALRRAHAGELVAHVLHERLVELLALHLDAGLEQVDVERDVRGELGLEVGLGHVRARSAQVLRPELDEAPLLPLGVIDQVELIAQQQVRLQVVVVVEVLRAGSLAQLVLERVLHRTDEALAQDVDVLVARRRVEPVALVHREAVADGRAVDLVLVEVLDVAAQLVELGHLLDGRPHPLPLDRLGRVGDAPRLGDEPPVVDEGDDRRDEEHQGEERSHRDGGVALPPQPRELGLGARGEPLVGEDHAHEHVAEEEALRLDLLRARLFRRAAQTEGAAHGADDAIEGLALLQAAGEVEAAEDRRRAGPLGERGLEEVGEAALDGRELERELVDLLLQLAVALERHALEAAGVELLDQDVELGVEQLAGRALVGVEEDGRAPRLRALALLQIAEELGEAGDEIDLGEEHVDRQGLLERDLHLVDARADLGGRLLDLIVGRVEQLAHAHRDDHAVQRLLGAVLEQRLEERHPLVVIVRLGGVAARGVEEDGLVGEPPVAVARAAHAAHAAALRIEVRELEAGVAQRGGLAGAGRADHQQVVASGSRDLDSPTGHRLAPDVGEVRHGFPVRHRRGAGGGLPGAEPSQRRHHRGQRGGGTDLVASEDHRLRLSVGRDHHDRLGQRLDEGHQTGDAPQRAVEPELTHERDADGALRRHHP